MSLSIAIGNDILKRKDIYLDTAATTKPNKYTVDSIMPYLTDKWYNPSSLYSESRNVSDDIKSARENIGNYIGAKGDEIYFTSGGSESNCWAIQGFVNYWKLKGYEPVIITSTIEHKSIISCVEGLCVDTHFVGVYKDGCVKMTQLEELLKYITKNNPKSKILVSVQFANNEIGIVQNIKAITKIAHKYSAFVHTDTVQIIGHLPIDVKELDIDMLSASGHKFNALKGIGFLYIKSGVKIAPLIYGSQNNSMRGGTENVAGIISMSKALDLCDVSYSYIKDKYAIREKFINKILKLNYNLQLNSSSDYGNSLPTIISLTIKENVTAEALVYILNSSGICISSGSACNSHSEEPSYVLKAIGLSDEDAVRTIRISFSDDLTSEDMDRFIDELNKAIRLLLS